jgi:hypothetical protein
MFILVIKVVDGILRFTDGGALKVRLDYYYIHSGTHEKVFCWFGLMLWMLWFNRGSVMLVNV